MRTLILSLLLLVDLTAQAATLGFPALPGGGLVYKQVQSIRERRFADLVEQKTDFSCGAAALATILEKAYGAPLDEQAVIQGMLAHADPEIVRTQGFSMLDMKRYAAALGYKSGGFRAEFSDLDALEHPALVPIHYAGFKHFVVVRDVYNDHVFVADPALGNISFTRTRFEEIWDQNVLFVIFPSGQEPRNALALNDRDMRLVDDRTVSLLAFREFPQINKITENQVRELGTGGDVIHLRTK